MDISINDVWHAAEESDTVLDSVIQSFLQSPYFTGDPTTTVVQWRIENYSNLRKINFPHVADIEDAKYKIRQGDPNGQIELDALDTDKTTIKLRFPQE